MPDPRHAAQFAIAKALDRVTEAGRSSPAPRPRPASRAAPAVRRAAGQERHGTGRAGSGAAPSAAQQAAAVDRFAALSAAARHAWLLTHLAALRAGRITLSEIP